VKKKYKLKYLKGLASSNEDDAHYYFQVCPDSAKLVLRI